MIVPSRVGAKTVPSSTGADSDAEATCGRWSENNVWAPAGSGPRVRNSHVCGGIAAPSCEVTPDRWTTRSASGGHRPSGRKVSLVPSEDSEAEPGSAPPALRDTPRVASGRIGAEKVTETGAARGMSRAPGAGSWATMEISGWARSKTRSTP